MALRALIGAGLVAGAAGAAGLAIGLAAPAQAAPGGMDFSCAPCVGDINNDGKNPWESTLDPDGDGKGAWENGVEAVNGGAWEKAFPPAE